MCRSDRHLRYESITNTRHEYRERKTISIEACELTQFIANARKHSLYSADIGKELNSMKFSAKAIVETPSRL